MNKLQEAASQYNDGLITAKEMLGKVIGVIGDAYDESSWDNETENTVKLAQELANRFGS